MFQPSNQESTQTTLFLTMDQASSERHRGFMSISNGDLVFTEDTSIWDYKLEKTEFIPLTSLNIFYCSYNAINKRKQEDSDAWIALCGKFKEAWNNNTVTLTGKYKNMGVENDGKMWMSDPKDKKTEFTSELLLCSNEIQNRIFRFFSACSNWDGRSNHEYKHDDTKDIYSKRQKITKDYIFKGKTDCINPITKFRVKLDYLKETERDPKEKENTNNIWRGGKITCYFVEVKTKYGTIVVQEYLCEEKYGKLYLDGGDSRYQYYQCIGTVETYTGGYAHDYIHEVLKDTEFSEKNWKEIYIRYLKNKTIKINIFSN